MDIVRARGQDPETCGELFILAAEILGVAAVSVGVSRLQPAPTYGLARNRDDRHGQARSEAAPDAGVAPDSGGDRGHRCSHSYAIPGAFERSWKAI